MCRHSRRRTCAEAKDAAEHVTAKDQPHDKGQVWGVASPATHGGARSGETRWAPRRPALALAPLTPQLTYLESFISICCRISCRSSSVLRGKMFRSSSSCLLGRFLSLTASSSFLHFLGRVPGGAGGGAAKTVLGSAGSVSLQHPPARSKRCGQSEGRCQLVVTSRGTAVTGTAKVPSPTSMAGRSHGQVSRASAGWHQLPQLIINSTHFFFSKVSTFGS